MAATFVPALSRIHQERETTRSKAIVILARSRIHQERKTTRSKAIVILA
jgi:hypothetical protein